MTQFPALDGGKPLPLDWEMRFDQNTGKWFFINHLEQTTTWDDPRPLSHSRPTLDLVELDDFKINSAMNDLDRVMVTTSFEKSEPDQDTYEYELRRGLALESLYEAFPRVDRNLVANILSEQDYDVKKASMVLFPLNNENRQTSVRGSNNSKSPTVSTPTISRNASLSPVLSASSKNSRKSSATSTSASSNSNRRNPNPKSKSSTSNTSSLANESSERTSPRPVRPSRSASSSKPEATQAIYRVPITQDTGQPEARKSIAKGPNAHLLLANVGCRRPTPYKHVCVAKGHDPTLVRGPSRAR